ncbi:MAG: hypothetical protein PHH09_05860 [Methanoregulaceae archaeon]|nr:hypothetical protein [Methanoregulaceae archaeon]
MPPTSSHVLISVPLHGGDGKNPLRAILTIAVVVAATATGQYYATYGALASATAAAAVTTAGMLLVNAIAPIKLSSTTSASQSYSDSDTYSIGASSNQENPWGTVPVILGTHKVYPPLGAKAYTEIVGADEYLRMLFVWGYGPMRIEDLKLGDTALTSYSNVEIETREGWSTDTPITLFPSQVYQTAVNTILTSTGGMVTRTAQANVDELSVDLAFPQGLVRFDDAGNRQSETVELTIQYREVGEEEWVDAPATRALSVSGTSISTYGDANGTYSVYVSNPEAVIYRALGTGEIEGSYRIGEYVLEGLGIIQEVTDLSPEECTGLVCTLQRTIGSAYQILYEISVTGGTAGTVASETAYFEDKTTSIVRRGFNWPVDKTKEYEVGITRTTADTDDDQIIDDVYWTNLRGIDTDDPLDFPYPVAVTAIRIKATDQINGVISDFNGLISSYAPVWDDSAEEWGSAEADYEVTNNPAALMRHVLTGNANARARTSTQIDDATLGEFYEFCETNGYAFNMYRDYRASVFETCQDIASAGRASVTIKDGLWSVTADTGTQTLVQHITPRNSWGFTAEKTLYNRPHAFRVKFKNEDNDYADDERIVYDDGYTSANATLFESIEFPGITSPDLIWKFGRFHIAQARLRPEVYSLYQDFEHLVCRRGDKVRVSHDVPLWGSSWGRIKSLTTSGSNITHITLDESVTMAAGNTYACRFRLSFGATLVLSVVLDVGETATLELTTPVAISAGPEVGDLAMFGETDSETVELLVSNITRAGDYTAQLSLVDVAEAIYDADTGEIPPFDPQTTTPIDITKFVPDPPTIDGVASGTDVSTTSGGGSVSTLIVYLSAPANAVRIRGYRIRYRMTNETEWQYTAEMSNLTITIFPVSEGVEYQVQAQSISVYGVHSLWSSTTTGQGALPETIPGPATGISAVLVSGGSSFNYCAVRVSFTPPSDVVYSFSEIYASNDDITYHYVGRDSSGSYTINGLGSIYELGDTCYIKLRSVSVYAVQGVLSETADASVLIDGEARFSSWYMGEYDLWGGNASISHADTQIVLGNLQGTAKIALGPSADAITYAGTETGFIVDGSGYFRVGGAQSLKWNVGTSTLMIGEWIVSPNGLADNFTEASATIFLDKTNARIQLGASASAISFAGTESGFYVDGVGNLRVGGTQSLKWNVTTSTLTIGEWIVSPHGLADNFTEANATILLDKTNARIQLGPSASAITFAGVEKGFYVDGVGNLRAGGTQSLKWNATTEVLTIGEWIVSPSGLADNFTEANATILLDKTHGRIQLGPSASAITFAGTETGLFIDGSGYFRVGGDQSLKWNVGTSTLMIGEWIVSPSGLADNWDEDLAKIVLDNVNTRIRIGPVASPYLIIDGDALNIRSSNYVSGIFGAGFSLDPDWLEVGNAHIRGMIRTAVFQKDVVSAVGGNLVILPADVLATDMDANDTSTF